MTALAAVFDGPGRPFRLVEFPVPPPGPGECVVSVKLATICGSDLHTIAGHRGGATPCVLGHEAVGVVEAAGEGVQTVDGKPVAVGDRVVWTVAASCGACFLCTRGLPQKCSHLKKFGKEPADFSRGPTGTLATHVRLWPGTGIVRVPADVPDEVAAPAMCATATVAACLRAAGPITTDDVINVYGLGMLGLTACAMVTSLGATAVGIDPDPTRTATATRFESTTSDRAPDVCLELSGATAAAEQALTQVRTGGTVIFAGSVSPGRPLAVHPEQLVRRCLTVRGVHNYAPPDLVAAVEFLADHHTRFPFAELVEHTFPLSEIEAAIDFAFEHRPVRVGVVQSPHEP
jgi:putative phosphonate catabolism associated alcohol dehydrogenase